MKKIYGISYLKLMLTVFVVAHHAFLAFTPSGVGSPIHDSNRTDIFSYITVIFDNFFMYTFFFIAGLFSVKTLTSKGSKKYIQSRVIRLGVVFFIGTYTINIIGFYFMEVFKGTDPNINIGFLNFLGYFTFVASNFHPAAHLWFLWVLLLFNVIFVVINPLITRTSKMFESISQNKTLFIILMLFLGYISHTVGYTFLGSDFVSIYGPFMAQIGRLPTYFLFYISAVIIGKNGLENSFIIKKKNTMIDTLLLFVGVLSGLLLGFLAIESPFPVWIYLWDILIVFIFVFITISLVSLFTNVFNKEHRVFKFLSTYAYMIYILHYAVVSALQGIFYNININGLFEGILVFLLGLILSLGFSILLSKIKVNKLIS
jgi:peptidoglycan/LPS O-acetylase OafA/YrhL